MNIIISKNKLYINLIWKICNQLSKKKIQASKPHLDLSLFKNKQKKNNTSFISATLWGVICYLLLKLSYAESSNLYELLLEKSFATLFSTAEEPFK